LLKGTTLIDSYVFKDEDLSASGFPNQNLIVGWVLRTVAIPNINPHQIMKTTQALAKQAITKREEKKVVAPISEAKKVELEKVPESELKRPTVTGWIKKEGMKSVQELDVEKRQAFQDRMKHLKEEKRMQAVQEKIGNKERILDLLKKNALTSKEIAYELNLSEKNTRTYLTRLKKEDKITDIGKTGRFLIYTHKEALTPRNQHDEIVALEGDLSYLLSLIELKMTPKDGVKFTPTDHMKIRRIEERIADKIGGNLKAREAIKDLIDFEQSFKEEINEKIANLEEKVDFITSRKVKFKKDEILEAKIGATDLNIEDYLTKPDSVKKLLKNQEINKRNQMIDEYDYLFKSIVVGDGGVGKTALTLRFSKGFFTEDYKMTIGVDFHVKTISIDTSEGPIKCKLQLWDTGGQERFSSIRPMYYRGSLGTILVFDLTNSASFEHLPQWIEEVRANIKAEIPVLLVGNKSDLIDQRAVSIEEISKFTNDFNLYYMETSAKTGDGVGDCFYVLACLMIGQGVPEQLIANTTVYAPGDVPKGGGQVSAPVTLSSEPQDVYVAPPVPEPTQIKESQPGIEYEAPPVPEPTLVMEPEFAPEISIPEPTEIEFKTPDEILIKEAVKSELETLTSNDKVYKPKTIPFTSNVPVPAPTPKEFQSSYSEKSIESHQRPTPFGVMKRGETPKPQPASMTFEPSPQPPPRLTGRSPIFHHVKPTVSSSDSLIDYMPQSIITKTEKKKIAKEKKKQDKEKAKIEKEKKTIESREKQENLIEAMKKPKKDKKEKQLEPAKSKPSQAPAPKKPKPEMGSLFQTITQKTEALTTSQSVPFMPFAGESKTKKEGKSKLRIIPNVADIEADYSTFTAFTSIQPIKEEKPKSKSSDLLVCEQCGTILSFDYAFCNKCGNKL